jgi:hypothetical protein
MPSSEDVADCEPDNHAPRYHDISDASRDRIYAKREGDVHNDVPESLLIERSSNIDIITPVPTGGLQRRYSPKSQVRFSASKRTPRNPQVPCAVSPIVSSPPYSSVHREEALWFWANITNVDRFLNEVYYYYRGAGFWCIACSRILHLWYVSFATRCHSLTPALSNVILPLMITDLQRNFIHGYDSHFRLAMHRLL